MKFEFEPTRSFCYKFARYVVLPEIQQLPEVTSGETFRLTELCQRVMDTHLSPDQQQTRLKKAHGDKQDPIHSIVKFVVALQAKHQEVFVNLGDGLFRSKTDADISDEELEESALEDGDQETAEFEGWIYAFSFPVVFREGVPCPIKVGKTIGDVADRVATQCKGSATFENPVVLGSWRVKRVGPTELAIHNVLKARGKWRENVPGTEWFDTTLAEIQAILDFVGAVKAG